MRQYQKFYEQMIADNQELFDTFKGIHDAYVLNPELNQAKFNDIGREVVDVIREYERKLCGNMNSGAYGAFSQNLSQKFWDEIRKVYKKIDFVGATVG
ncbi:MAG TPA: hypothetical protein VMR81_04335 [Patescibacteria group bacterium]|jgi:hypothetical protein|nr:hypothetical protein [Patescibacteria group bacterium]